MRNKLFRLAASSVVAVLMASIVVNAMPQAAIAATATEGFAAPWTAGTPLVAQNDWGYTGGGNYDVGVVGSGIDGQSVRISNAVMSGSFGDWLFSPAIGPATENVNQEFTAQFKIRSASGAEQQGLSMNVAPQTTGGARMSNLRFEDRGDGVHVIFSDVLNPSETVDFQNSPFRLVDIATLSYDETHTVKIVMNLKPGPHNDVVQVYIDGSAGLVPGRAGEATFEGFYAPVDNQPTINKAKAGQTIPLKWRLAAESFATSWEDYYRYDQESNGGVGTPNPPTSDGYGTRQVDSLIFQARCASSGPCANTGLLPITDTPGYLIDDVTYTSSQIGTPLPVATQGVSDPAVYGNSVFSPALAPSNECASSAGDLDPIETYTSNAGGLMYHGNGVWQYNWQTPKSYGGKCVELTLNYTGDSTLFKFTK